ncbi:hypothetical protein [Streptomyces sp. AC555_RSS877]|uniref:hypothetical protein n=1 Tax=Streptomyces sp. AC555_RSS877 TaxID=2823688 RepID=UPI001C2812CD|nr:hypothetical protein [Streptomyces sp. AC555_RSS877]
MAKEFGLLYELLMDWVYEKVGDHRYKGADLKSFAAEHAISDETAIHLRQYGMNEGGVDDKWATPRRPAVSLTLKGLELVAQRRKFLAPSVERNKAARRAVLRQVWLDDEAGLRWSFTRVVVGTREATVAGYALSARELDRAAGYLKSKGLINGYTGSFEGPEQAQITAEGQDCMENYNGDPDLYEGRGRIGATYNTYLPNAQGVIVGEQQNFTQNNTAGIDPSAFIQLAGYVGQISSTLGLAEADRVELQRVAQELHNESTSPAPQSGRMRQIAGQIKDRLLEAGTTMAATVGIQMAEQALATLAH